MSACMYILIVLPLPFWNTIAYGNRKLSWRLPVVLPIKTLPFRPNFECVCVCLCHCVCCLHPAGGHLGSSAERRQVAIKTSSGSSRQTVVRKRSASTPTRKELGGNQSFALAGATDSTTTTTWSSVCVCSLFSCQSSNTQRGRGWLMFSKQCLVCIKLSEMT